MSLCSVSVFWDRHVEAVYIEHIYIYIYIYMNRYITCYITYINVAVSLCFWNRHAEAV
jgi:hypothetical protein